MPNAETQTPLTLRRDGKGRIWSHIRQGWFVEFPEEVVRQEFVCRLVNDYGFSLDQMGEELEVERGRQSAEADIVLWRTVQDKRDAKPPLIVVECKADNVTISPKDYGQGESYARIVDAPFFVTHNNRETRFWRVKKDRLPSYSEEITDSHAPPPADGATVGSAAPLRCWLLHYRHWDCAGNWQPVRRGAR